MIYSLIQKKNLKKMVNKLKNILTFFEERKAYNDTINKKTKEINSIRNQMNKIAEKKGFLQ